MENESSFKMKKINTLNDVNARELDKKTKIKKKKNDKTKKKIDM